jgi:uncharacterized YigZ family protein
MTDAFRTVAEPASARITRSKSRFLSFLLPVSSHEGIEAELARLRRIYHDASHVCFAYRLREGLSPREGADDAGEPAGSAGPPILRRIEEADLSNVLAVVVRYFGGTKLGIGGLIRAYSDAVQGTLEAARVVVRPIEVEVRIAFPPEATSGVMSTIHRHGAKIRHIEYDPAGSALVVLPSSQSEAFVHALREATGARATAEVQT